MIAFFSSRGRPPKDKKNRKPCYAIGCIIVSVGAHALGKDAAYNAEKRAGPQSPNPFPSVPGSLIILYRPNRVTVPKMQSLRHTVAREPLTCGAGTCVPRVPEIQSLPQTAAREPVTCGAGTRVPRVPDMQVYHTLRRGNQSHEARESRRSPKRRKSRFPVFFVLRGLPFLYERLRME